MGNSILSWLIILLLSSGTAVGISLSLGTHNNSPPPSALNAPPRKTTELLSHYIAQEGTSLQSANYIYSQPPPQQSPAQPDPAIWRPVGPAPISCGGAGNMCSGRVTTIAPDPANAGTLYLGGAQGGVWKSTDNGGSWTPLTDDQPSLAIGSIAVGPSGTVYAGTGEPNGCSDCFHGAGLLKSTDGGASWYVLGASTFGSTSFTRIIISPTNPNHLLASTTAGVYNSTNGGTTWTETLIGGVSDIVMDPSTPSTFYAADNGRMYKSVDGGVTWAPLTSWTNCCFRISLAISAAAPNTIFAAVGDGSGRLWESTTAGVSWSELTAEAGWCSNQCSYDIFVAVDPTNVNVIYLGGKDLFLSTNGGTTHADIGPGCCNSTVDIHPDEHAFAFSPSNHNTIYLGTDGGIWTTTVGGPCSGGVQNTGYPNICWNNLNNNLSLTQFYSLGVSPTDPGVYIGGAQDNGVVVRKCDGAVVCNPSTWFQPKGGDGGWTGFDPKDASIVYATVAPYNPGNIVNIYRSDDGGITFSTSLATLGSPSENGLLFPQIIAIDPTNPNFVYAINATFRQLLRSNNMGQDGWSNILYTLPPGEWISAIAVAPTNGQQIYFGTGQGKFFHSTNGGASFSEADTGLPSREISAIAIDNSDPSKVTVSLEVSNTGGKHVFYTTNGGTTWGDISGNLPDLSANTLVLSNGNLFVGLDQGVWTAGPPFSGQSVWTKAGTGLPNVQVAALAVAANGFLVAATNGRGVWIMINIPAPGASSSFAFTKTWGIASGSNGQGDAIAISKSAVYVAGKPGSGGTQAKILLLSYDFSGNLNWQWTWGGSGPDNACCVAADANGNVYVAGSTTLTTPPNLYAFLLKIDPTITTGNNIVWGAQWGDSRTTNANSTGVLGIAVDDTDSVVDVLAYTASPPGNAFPVMYLMQFPYGGGTPSQIALQGNGYLTGSRIAVDLAGDIYVTGTVSTNLGGGTAYDHLLLLKFNKSLTLQWGRTWGPNFPITASGIDIATDTAGNSYIVGAVAATSSSSGYVALVKFDKDGNLQQDSSWGGTGSETARSIWVDFPLLGEGTGEVYVAGRTNSFGSGGTCGAGELSHTCTDGFLLKLDSTLDFVQAWTVGAAGVDDSLNAVRGEATTSEPKVFTTGYVASAAYAVSSFTAATLPLGIAANDYTSPTVKGNFYTPSTPTWSISRPAGSTSFVTNTDEVFAELARSPATPSIPIGYALLALLTALPLLTRRFRRAKNVPMQENA